MSQPPVSISLLWTVLHHLEHYEVPYLYGGKAVTLNCDTSQIRGIDCSGFTRYALAKASSQQLILPDGSATQAEWCAAQGLHRVDYRNVLNPAYQISSNGVPRLFIAFYVAPAGSVGHAWLVSEGRTLESCGHRGPTSRDASLPMLQRICAACYELPATL